jgi:hypothetical protein
VGHLDPRTAHCDEHRCSAVVLATRGVEREGGRAVSLEGVVVSLDRDTVVADRSRGASWKSAREAFSDISETDTIVIAGNVDADEAGRATLAGSRLARVDVPSQNGPALFPKCVAPPWSQTTLVACFESEQHERAVKVEGTLMLDAAIEPEDLEDGARPVLTLGDLKVTLGDETVTAPSSVDFVTVERSAKLTNPSVRRPKVGSLLAGDRVSIEGVYRLPAPPQANHADGELACLDSHCWPALVATRSISVRPRE